MSHDAVSDLPVFMPVGDTGWMEQGACRGLDPRIFFPKGPTPGLLRAICASCPVRQECLQWALDNEEYGFWGGTTTTERSVMLHGNLRTGWRR